MPWPHKKSLAINLNIPYSNNMNSIHDDYNTQPQSDEYATEHEEVRGTFAAEPAVEQEPQPYDGFEGQWPGDGSGFDDLADLGEQEGWDN
jgi:hypothetical protein